MRRSVFSLFLPVVALVALSACTLKSQTVALDPALENEAFNVGQGRPVHVMVRDRRDTELVGYRKGEVGQWASIRTGDDTASTIEARVREAVTDKGFEVVANAAPSVASLTIEIEDIAYRASGAFVAPSVTTRVILKAIAARSGTTFEQVYRLEKQSREALPLTAERNTRLLNETLGEVLTTFADDYEVMNFLAGAPPPETAR